MFWNKKIQTEIIIEGMHCKHCAAAVTEALKNIKGVSGVEVDLANKKATVFSRNPLDNDALKAAVADAGFEVVEIK